MNYKQNTNLLLYKIKFNKIEKLQMKMIVKTVLYLEQGCNAKFDKCIISNRLAIVDNVLLYSLKTTILPTPNHFPP